MADFSFTAKELSNLLASAIDYHQRGEVAKQSVQNKNLLKDLEAGSKGFPGGLEFMTWRAKGDYTTTEVGYSGDEVVDYQNPANIRQAQAKWYERHAGIKVTFTELKVGGISVVENGANQRTEDQAESAATRLANIWDDKLDDMTEGRARTRSRMFWNDGSSDPRDVPGVTYWVTDTPTSSLVVGGIDQGANTWWRNRVSLGLVANASNAANNVLINTLQLEYRQLTRYGGKPTKIYAGSDALTQLEAELRARGNYTLTGWAKSGGLDVSMDDINFKGTQVVYEPELDDMGFSKRLYWLQVGKGGLQLMHMNGERDQKHNPARPENRYVIYQAVTWTGGMICQRRNGNGVYSIA